MKHEMDKDYVGVSRVATKKSCRALRYIPHTGENSTTVQQDHAGFLISTVLKP